MLRSIQKLIGDKRKQLIFPIFLMSLDAIGSLVMYLMLYFTVIHLLNGSLTGGLVRNYCLSLLSLPLWARRLLLALWLPCLTREVFEQSATVDTAALSTSMLSVISRPEALAFLFAFFFNMPCLMALTATAQETHSMKWTVRIALYYVLTALIMATIAYHVGLVIF